MPYVPTPGRLCFILIYLCFLLGLSHLARPDFVQFCMCARLCLCPNMCECFTWAEPDADLNHPCLPLHLNLRNMQNWQTAGFLLLLTNAGHSPGANRRAKKNPLNCSHASYTNLSDRNIEVFLWLHSSARDGVYKSFSFYMLLVPLSQVFIVFTVCLVIFKFG